MASGEPYQKLKGEFIVEGAIRYDCGNSFSSSDDLMDKLEGEGIQWGDAVAWVTKKLGVQSCAPCKARQVILNHMTEVGFINTIKALKDT